MKTVGEIVEYIKPEDWERDRVYHDSIAELRKGLQELLGSPDLVDETLNLVVIWYWKRKENEDS